MDSARTIKTIDPRTVLSTDRARRFLAAVTATGPRGERMTASFALMYAAVCPEEAISGSHVTPGLGPLVILLGQDGADHADDGIPVREDPDDVGPPPDLFMLLVIALRSSSARRGLDLGASQRLQ
jgi:hypothetical protein